MRKRLIVDAARIVLDISQSIGVTAGDDLLQNALGRIEVLRLCQDLRHTVAVVLVRDVQARGHNRAVERHEGVRILCDPAFRCGDGAARMAVPYLPGNQMDESRALVNRALATGFAAEE